MDLTWYTIYKAPSWHIQAHISSVYIRSCQGSTWYIRSWYEPVYAKKGLYKSIIYIPVPVVISWTLSNATKYGIGLSLARDWLNLQIAGLVYMWVGLWQFPIEGCRFSLFKEASSGNFLPSTPKPSSELPFYPEKGCKGRKWGVLPFSSLSGNRIHFRWIRSCSVSRGKRIVEA